MTCPRPRRVGGLAAAILAMAAAACSSSKGPVDLTTVYPAQETVPLPGQPDSLKFAVIGDSGTGDRNQRAVARALVDARARFPFTVVLMAGDNLYGPDAPTEYRRAFEVPYKPLLDAGVKFYAALGNHDNPNQRFYELFNMGGERYYSFRPAKGVRVFALDSNYMSKEQLAWLEKELAASGSDWKICFFHHPLYSSGGRHGPALDLRKVLEPVLVRHGVNVVFSGHEHFYERLKPQNGIFYFTSGAAGKLRRGDINATDQTARGFDTDFSFMLVEIAGDQMYFQSINRAEQVVDSGRIQRAERKQEQAAGSRP